MSKQYEVKVKHIWEKCIDWESLPVDRTYTANITYIEDTLINELIADNSIHEFRFNAVGSLQGHYVSLNRHKNIPVWDTRNDVPDHIKHWQDDVNGYRAIMKAFQQLLNNEVNYIAFFCGDLENEIGSYFTFTKNEEMDRIRFLDGYRRFEEHEGSSLRETFNYGLGNDTAIICCAVEFLTASALANKHGIKQVYRLKI